MSKIEWTEKTWNPTTGCTKVSAGCKNCYAEKMHKRLNAMKTKGYEQPFNQVICHHDRLDIPLKRKKPTTYFVNSMSDLFHENVPFDFIMNVFEIMAIRSQHTYQILTKRSSRMNIFTSEINVPKNVWLGVSVENQEQANERIGHLIMLKANKKFLSCEPLLGDIDFSEVPLLGTTTQNPLEGYVDWVIVGGESGKNARPMKKEWVLNIKRQCKEQGVPFFFKQWGAYGEDGVKRSKKANGCLIDGVEYKAMP